MILHAHAKINFSLHVLGRRPDGYHELAMLMQQVSLADQIRISLNDTGKVTMRCPGLTLAAGEENIAARAGRLLLAHAGLEVGLDIEIDKQIPVAAGLGGGSSNAAAILRGVNELFDLSLPQSELMELGVRLGADVPFFLFGATAWATGIGEQLQPWPAVPPLWLVLVNPNVAVSTAWVYGNLGLTGSGAVVKLPKFPGGVQGLVRLLHNDLEAVTVQRYPVVDHIKQRLRETGALGALMSGSGPTVFGVFEEKDKAERAAAALAAENDWWIKVVTPL